MPKVLQPGVLYVSETYETAAHLCACGCGTKIRTPLGPTEWAVEATPTGPTLRPSVGNWQQPCRSHYLISAGEVVWAESWTPAEVAQGRQRELARRHSYYNALPARAGGLLFRLRSWLSALRRGR
jgi:hypothetical protein